MNRIPASEGSQKPSAMSPANLWESETFVGMVEAFLTRCGITAKRMETIRARLGLIDGKVKTLQAIGDTMKLTRERIRQFQVDVIRTVNLPDNAALLTVFWDSARKAVKANNDEMELENLWIVLQYKFRWTDDLPVVVFAQFLKLNRQFEIVRPNSRKTILVRLKK